MRLSRRDRRWLPTIIAGGAALVAAISWANPIDPDILIRNVGIVTARLAIGLLAEPLVIIVEGFVYARVLRWPKRRAYGVSALANVVSFLAGGLAAWLLIGVPGRPSYLTRSAVGMAVIIVTEIPIVMAFADPPERLRAVRVTALTNLCTYTVLRYLIYAAGVAS